MGILPELYAATTKLSKNARIFCLWVREWIQSNVAGISSNSSTNEQMQKNGQQFTPPGQQFYQGGGNQPQCGTDRRQLEIRTNRPGTPYYLKTPEESKFDPSVEQESVASAEARRDIDCLCLAAYRTTRASA